MSNIKNILGMSQNVDDIGDIYPIKVKDYEEFSKYASILQYGEKHFDKEHIEQYSLFRVLIVNLNHSGILDYFLKLLSMTTKKEFILNDSEDIIFYSEDGSYINKDNYNQFREVVMKQNLIYEEKVFKNQKLKEWADKVLQARQRNSVDYTMEDMISVVHVFVGLNYDEIANQTVYQLNEDFQRIMKIEDYNKTIQFMCAGNDKIKPTPFFEKINLYKDPYADVFVDKGKLGDLDKAINK